MPESDRSRQERNKKIVKRDKLWPGSKDWVWDYKEQRDLKGFATMPRVLPLVILLVSKLAAGIKNAGDPGAVYLELWSRVDSCGLVGESDDGDAAYRAGYSSQRGRRTWEDHMQLLVDFGFILAKSAGSRKFAKVLILNPFDVCVRIKQEGQMDGDWFESWWAMFAAAAEKSGATIPEVPSLPSSADKPAPTTS